MMNSDPKLYFDCTSTIRSGLNTGVQRVVRGLLAQKAVFERELSIEFVPICHQFDWYYRLDDALAMAELGRVDLACEKISFSYRDIYLCADAFWSMDMTAWLPFIHSRGATIVNVIYDLIPLTYPQFFARGDIDGFRQALDKVIASADLLPCISRATRAELKHYMSAHAGDAERVCTGVFSLAPGLSADANAAPSATKDGASPYLLAVGTLEPRKGVLRLIEEMEQVWAAGNPLHLVLVGKRGAGAGEIVERIETLAQQGRPLSWRSDVSDDELKVFYEGAMAVICPSHAEGFGLPLAEAMSHGKPVYANRLPVFGEFAGSYPYYFDIDVPGDLSKLIQERAGREVRRAAPEFASWEDSAAELSALIRQVAPLYEFGMPPYKQRTSPTAVAWAYRLILGREVEGREVAAEWRDKHPTIPGLARALQAEVRSMEPLSADAVRWAYRLILGREVDGEATVDFWREKCSTLPELARELYSDLLVSEKPVSPESITLAYRIILNQPVDDESIDFWMKSGVTLSELRDHLVYVLTRDGERKEQGSAVRTEQS